ncbi:selenium metabolism-associated LysR family transcriptional regulator [Neobacillus niacini]|uniref:selenium metabolism-associated LysR family transcriptional regulator n=1 Tax=Neobacillus niacini TaxID=86668 RepID=UPI0021CB80D5|nr:selenium metabolism-associated LysR family transcriptional regulator [Neobacillus niacini]MCM3766916.1 selenium metabolism-associated LysR family transcriptional regulator [Neobacillus niacini]
MYLEHLKVFHLAATKKNFSETAKILHLPLPTVSLQIKHLEDYLNTSLFDRNTKKMELTDSGKILFHYAEEILQLVNKAEKELALLSETIHGDLRLGASLTIGEYLLPHYLGDFLKKYPHVHVSMKVDNSHKIVEKLLNGEIDLGFIEVTIPHEKLDSIPFLEDELVVISQSVSSLFDEISVEELFGLPIIMREKGSGTRQVLEANLLKKQLNPDNLNIVLELENTESIKSAVQSGLGVAILSRTAIQKETELGIFKQTRIIGVPLTRYFYILNKKGILSPATDAFKELFLHAFR